MPLFVATAADAALALLNADESESEAVALACIELLFAETNACYAQHVLACRSVSRVSKVLASNIIDAVSLAVLREDRDPPTALCAHEASPRAGPTDRHAARALPCRSPEKPGASEQTNVDASSLSRDSRSSSSPEKLPRVSPLAAGGPLASRSRRKAADKAMTPTTAPADRSVLAIAAPEIQQLPEEDDEKPDILAWRAACLKELSGVAKRRSTFTKWATIARAFTPSSAGQKVSLDIEIVESTPSLLHKELGGHSPSSAAAASTAVRMKSNIDSFSGVLDVSPDRTGGGDDLIGCQHTSRSHWSSLDALYENHAVDSSALPLPSSTVAPASTLGRRQSKGAGVVILNDTLSRKKSGAASASAEHNTVSSTLWRRRSRSRSTSTSGPGNGSPQAFVPECSDFNVQALPCTIKLASGVVLTQGESLVEGPARIESPNTMSRKRFDLHQSVATDLLLHWNERSGALASSVSSPSLHHHHHNAHVDPCSRPYAEVPADPIPAPQLSPIPATALVIPRTHLAQSLSAPALRVRSPTNGRGGTAGSFGLDSASSGSMAALPARTTHAALKHRPRTAFVLGSSAASSTTLVKHKKSARVGSASATSKYQREFPRPQAGAVRLSQLDDDSKRLAWISS